MSHTINFNINIPSDSNSVTRETSDESPHPNQSFTGSSMTGSETAPVPMETEEQSTGEGVYAIAPEPENFLAGFSSSDQEPSPSPLSYESIENLNQGYDDEPPSPIDESQPVPEVSLATSTMQMTSSEAPPPDEKMGESEDLNPTTKPATRRQTKKK